MEQTISPRQLRRWFGRVALTLLVTFVVSQALSYLSVQVWMSFAGWANYTILMFLNDLCVYVPSIILIPLLLRSIPRLPSGPPTALSGQETFLAVVFSLGSGYLFSYVTLALIHLLEGFAGQSSTNTVSAVESSLPPVVAIVAFAVVAPVARNLSSVGCCWIGCVSSVTAPPSSSAGRLLGCSTGT